MASRTAAVGTGDGPVAVLLDDLLLGLVEL